MSARRRARVVILAAVLFGGAAFGAAGACLPPALSLGDDCEEDDDCAPFLVPLPPTFEWRCKEGICIIRSQPTDRPDGGGMGDADKDGGASDDGGVPFDGGS